MAVSLSASVGRGPVAFVEVGGVGRVGPGVAIHANLAVAVKVIERNVFLGKSVLVGVTFSPKIVRLGSPLAFEITEDLIVGPVLFNDVDDVLDLGGDTDAACGMSVGASGGRASESRESLYGVLSMTCLVQCGSVFWMIGDRQRLDTALLERLDGLVAVPLRGERTAWSFSIGMTLFALWLLPM